MLTLIGSRLPCGNDSDDISAGTLALAHDQYPQYVAQTKHNESFFARRMFLVEELPCILIKENGLRLLERNTVLLEICTRLLRIPIELYHTYIVCMHDRLVNPRYVQEYIAQRRAYPLVPGDRIPLCGTGQVAPSGRYPNLCG